MFKVLNMRTISVDVETTAIPVFKPWQKGAFLVSVGMVDEYGFRKIWVFNHDEITGDVATDQIDMVQEIQAEFDKSTRIVGHNLKFDLAWLRKVGLDYSNLRLYCTQVVEYLIECQQKIGYHLNDCCERRGISTKIDLVKKYWEAGYNTNEIPLRILNPYLEQDCVSTLALYQKQVPLIKQHGLAHLVQVQMECLRVLAEIEWNGMYINQEVAAVFVEDFRKKFSRIDTKLQRLFGWDVNFNSGDELSVALFGGVLKRDCKETYVTTKNVSYKEPYTYTYKDGRTATKYKTRKLPMFISKQRNSTEEVIKKGVGFKPEKGTELKKKGYFQTGKEVIKRLTAGKDTNLKQIKTLLQERSVVGKVLETFAGKVDDGDKGLLNKIQEDGCIHSQYNQTIARTGRLTSSDPNGQNLPRKGTSPIKQIIYPRHDFIVVPDLSQLEWRVAAHLSRDEQMMHEIATGTDAHLDNAIKFFGDAKFRQDAKIFTFRMIYGGSAYSFYMDPKMPNFSKKKWEGIVNAFYQKYQGLKLWQDKNVNHVFKHGCLISPTGRILKFRKVESWDGTMQYKPTHIKNYPVQSLATADIMPLAMSTIYRKIHDNFKSLIIGQVHDSLVFDSPKEEVRPLSELCVDVFEDLPNLIKKTWGFDFIVPLTGEVEVGLNYGELKEYNFKEVK